MIYLDQRSYKIPTFSKTKVKFEISTFEIGYSQNIVKIRKVIVFDLKCPNLGISKLSKTNVKFEISTFEIRYMRSFAKIRELILFGPNALIWVSGLKIFKDKWQAWNQHIRNGVYANFVKIRKLILFGPKSPNLGIWDQNLKNES